MIGLHSTHLKKLYSDTFETNALQPVNLVASEVLQPVKELKPESEVFLSNGTLDSRRTFYVTSIVINAMGDGADTGSVVVSVYRENGGLIQFTTSSTINQANNAIKLDFAGKGLRLVRGSQYAIAPTSSMDFGCIIGYYEGERS